MASYSGADNRFHTPIPASIALYNRLPSPPSSSEFKSKKWFRLKHSTNLLVSVRLEIFLKVEDEESIVIFSSQHDNSSIHTIWNHLNEKIKDWDEYLSEQPPSIFARIFSIDKGDTSLIVDSVPLHPKSLRRLPNEEESSQIMQPPPPALPPNALLIHYTDGLVRVEASLYHILRKKGIIHERDPRDASLIDDDVEEDRRTSRFHDDLFDVLDQVETVEKSGPKSLIETNENVSTPVNRAEFECNETSSPPINYAKEEDIELEDWLRERDDLLKKIAAEEVLLSGDRQDLEQQQHELISTMKHVEKLQREESLIREEICQIR